MREIRHKVVGELGNVYELDRELGRGGQGIVFAIKNGRHAVKILLDRSPIKRTQLSRQLKHVQILFDIRNLAIAKPLEILKEPNLGYVMELLTDMVPINQLINIPKNTNCLVEWYLQGGGLRRRLLLLAHCAEILSQLHGKGLVYGDPSPNNIFISSDINNHEVIRLIDADNLQYESNLSSINYYTPEFGAPELITGKSGVNTLTDAHAFAVIAFKALRLNHPLMGDMVNDGEPELETQALEGKLPWIDHTEDHRNSTNNGFPGDIVFSYKLKELCQKHFQIGLREPTKRPGIAQWTKNLYEAADFTIHCPGCYSTYYATRKTCPWCNRPRPTYILVRVLKCDPAEKIDFKQTPLQHLALALSHPIIITNRISTGRIEANSHNSNIEIIFEEGKVKVRSLERQCFWLTSTRTNTKKEVQDKWLIFSPVKETTSEIWILHFGNLDQSHRCAIFQLVSGVDI